MPVWPTPVLYFVEGEQDARFVGDGAQFGEETGGGGGADPAFALDGFDEDRRGLGADGGARRVGVAERDVDETVHGRPEAFERLFVAAGGERRQGAPVEGALEGDDAPASGIAAAVVVAPRHLDYAFHRLGARIAEEHLVGEARGAQAFGEARLFGDFVEVGAMPQFLSLGGERRNQPRVAVAQGIDRDAGGEVEEAPPVGGDQVSALAALEGDADASIGGHDGHHDAPPQEKRRTIVIAVRKSIRGAGGDPPGAPRSEG